MRALDKEMAPQVLETPRSPAHRKVGTLAVDTRESSAPHAHPSTEDHDDTVETQYSGLERLRPHACNAGWITLGQFVSCEETEAHVLYPCRCAEEGV
jgi:hypothetical protein